MSLKDLIISPESGALESLERAYDAATYVDEHGNTVFDAGKVWRHLVSEGWNIRYDRLTSQRYGGFEIIEGGKD